MSEFIDVEKCVSKTGKAYYKGKCNVNNIPMVFTIFLGSDGKPCSRLLVSYWDKVKRGYTDVSDDFELVKCNFNKPIPHIEIERIACEDKGSVDEKLADMSRRIDYLTNLVNSLMTQQNKNDVPF